MGKEITLIEKHSLWIRWTHWINFPLLALMVWSGIWIYWANDIYRPFFPSWFYQWFHVDHKLAQGMAVHFTIAWLFTLNGLLYLTYIVFSGHWRELLPGRGALSKSVRVLLHDLRLIENAPPQCKFNAAQQVAYTVVALMGIGSVLSGLAIYKPTQLYWLTSVFGGYEGARLVHFILTAAFVIFFVIHIAQVARAGWNNFRSMIAGFEIQSKNEKNV